MTENQGVTHITRHIPFDWLNLHQSGRPNRISIRFTEGVGHVFLQSLRMSAELPPPGQLGRPPVTVQMQPGYGAPMGAMGAASMGM